VFFANIELNFIPAIPAANANPPPTISRCVRHGRGLEDVGEP
jgi:hypothetical protein